MGFLILMMASIAMFALFTELAPTVGDLTEWTLLGLSLTAAAGAVVEAWAWAFGDG